ncbi:hypothetical protein C440_09087 [Haloferax mucosum ATCC BAA-1512]|uniref:Uncharacterized protein n=1 Tax=Haloferax mucosum ATCC BAA-1512 TaxID=662479 RepID=M0IEL8_9EURY|nr:hypothetical protein [Haloferax mucosum]ELZ95220.1 hypothetical protein C440_09087 [Haloferax mucosum ATCC BAA-1512]
MTPDATASVDDSGAEVMASVDSTQTGQRLIIADISRDDAWLAADVADALALDDWR